MARPKDWYRGPGWGHPTTREAKRELAERLARGETWRAITRSTGMSRTLIARTLNEAGGMPARWKARPARVLSTSDREEIRVGLDAGDSFASIARRLGRPTSTVSREVARNGGRAEYRAWRADRRACERARRQRPSKLVTNTRLRAEVEARLLERCSPQQISRILSA